MSKGAPRFMLVTGDGAPWKHPDGRETYRRDRAEAWEAELSGKMAVSAERAEPTVSAPDLGFPSMVARIQADAVLAREYLIWIWHAGELADDVRIQAGEALRAHQMWTGAIEDVMAALRNRGPMDPRNETPFRALVADVYNNSGSVDGPWLDRAHELLSVTTPPEVPPARSEVVDPDSTPTQP